VIPGRYSESSHRSSGCALDAAANSGSVHDLLESNT
jgi:hypothetical protein